MTSIPAAPTATDTGPLGTAAGLRRWFAPALLFALIALRLAWHLASRAGMYWDFLNFYNAGRRIAEGRFGDLYAAAEPLFGGADLPEGILTYVGFPLSALPFAPLGLFGPARALLLFKLACVVCTALGVAWLASYAWRRYGSGAVSPRAVAVFLLALLVWEPFWFSLTVGGQATDLAFPLLVLALVLHADQRDLPAGAAIAVAVLLKPVLAPMGVVMLVARAWRLAASTVVTGLLLAGASLLLFGLPLHAEWMQAVSREGARWEMPWWNNASIAEPFISPWVHGSDTMREVTAMPGVPAALALGARALAALIVLVAAWRMTQGDEARAVREQTIVLGLVLSLCASNVIWPHYLLYVLVPWTLLAVRWETLGSFARALVVLLPVSVLRASLIVNGALQDWLDHDTWWGPALSGLAGSGTLLLLLAATAAGVLSPDSAQRRR